MVIAARLHRRLVEYLLELQRKEFPSHDAFHAHDPCATRGALAIARWLCRFQETPVTMPCPELLFAGETTRRQVMLHEKSHARTSLQEKGCRLPAPIIDIVEKDVQGLSRTATH